MSQPLNLIDGSSDINLSLLFSILQVPFIAFYRKEYVEPELNINDLWKVWQWDEKVRTQSNCSQNALWLLLFVLIQQLNVAVYAVLLSGPS